MKKPNVLKHRVFNRYSVVRSYYLSRIYQIGDVWFPEFRLSFLFTFIISNIVWRLETNKANLDLGPYICSYWHICQTKTATSHVTLTLALSVQGHTVSYVYLWIYVCSRWIFSDYVAALQSGHTVFSGFLSLKKMFCFKILLPPCGIIALHAHLFLFNKYSFRNFSFMTVDFITVFFI